MFKEHLVNVRKLGRLEARPPSGHKGTFGTACVVGGCCRGSVRYLGAPALASLGALRSGCGLCRVLAPEPLIGRVLGIATSATGVALAVGRDGGVSGPVGVKSLKTAASESHVLVVGPGLGRGPGVDAMVRYVWEQQDVPFVLDADGLNALSEMRMPLPPHHGGRAPAVVTPHPGEAKRLMSAFKVKGDPTEARERGRIAIELSHRMACVVVLKGERTVVSDGAHVYTNASGGPWLATGGTGDILAGVIGGLIAQHIAGGGDPSGLFRMACLGVLVHGRAGDAWAKEKKATGGMLAIELAERIPAAVERLRR
ncbi:MAG: NAD(P)H-hydrate dehydratase [Phycisphaerales bacterium]